MQHDCAFQRLQERCNELLSLFLVVDEFEDEGPGHLIAQLVDAIEDHPRFIADYQAWCLLLPDKIFNPNVHKQAQRFNRKKRVRKWEF